MNKHNYQRNRDNPFKLPHNVYMRILYIIKDYDRMKCEQNDIILSSPGTYSGSKGQHGDPTANKALKITLMSRETDAIEMALVLIPKEYRQAVWQNVAYGDKYPAHADYTTYSRWRQRFIYYVAVKLNVA